MIKNKKITLSARDPNRYVGAFNEGRAELGSVEEKRRLFERAFSGQVPSGPASSTLNSQNKTGSKKGSSLRKTSSLNRKHLNRTHSVPRLLPSQSLDCEVHIGKSVLCKTPPQHHTSPLPSPLLPNHKGAQFTDFKGQPPVIKVSSSRCSNAETTEQLAPMNLTASGGPQGGSDKSDHFCVRTDSSLTPSPPAKKGAIVRQKSLNRTMSTSVLRIKKKRSFWNTEKSETQK